MESCQSQHKNPATECNKRAPRDFESVASLRAAQRDEGTNIAAPCGAWTQVLLGWHNHVEITQDGA